MSCVAVRCTPCERGGVRTVPLASPSVFVCVAHLSLEMSSIYLLMLQVARFFVSATFLSRFGFRSFETALLHTSMKSVVTDSCVPLSLRAPTTHTHTHARKGLRAACGRA